MTVPAGNLFADISAASAGGEASCEILAWPGLKIERIISQGQASPPEFWYDQAWNEWVIVLKGRRHVAVRRRACHTRVGRGRLRLHPRKETPPRRVDGAATANRLARRPLRVSVYCNWINGRHLGIRDNTTPQEAAAALRRAPLCPFCGTQLLAARIQLIPCELPPRGDRAAPLLVDRVSSSLALRLTQQWIWNRVAKRGPSEANHPPKTLWPESGN